MIAVYQLLFSHSTHVFSNLISRITCSRSSTEEPVNAVNQKVPLTK